MPRRYTAAERAWQGTEKANPARYASRTNDNTLQPLGYCPKHLSPAQKAIWRELVRLAPGGLLTVSDTFSVELAVRLIEHSRTAPTMKASEVAALMTLLGKLGLSPADRQRLDLPAPKSPEDGAFDEFV